MKKDVTEIRVFCDYCDQPGYTQCLVCGKDLCPKHRVELEIHLDRRDQEFMASLCPEDAQPLLPVLKAFRGTSTLEKAGRNPEFNEARLDEILAFLEQDKGGH